MKFFAIIALQFVCRLLSGSIVELMATSSKRTYAHGVPPRSAEARASSLSGHCKRHSNTQRQVWVSFCRLGPGVHKVLFEYSEVSGWYGVLILNMIRPSYSLVGAPPLPLDMAYLFLVRPNILLLVAV